MAPRFMMAYEAVLGEKKMIASLNPERAHNFIKHVLGHDPRAIFGNLDDNPDLISFWLSMFDPTHSEEITWATIQSLIQVRPTYPSHAWGGGGEATMVMRRNI
jgi:hypothetical protein